MTGLRNYRTCISWLFDELGRLAELTAHIRLAR